MLDFLKPPVAAFQDFYILVGRALRNVFRSPHYTDDIIIQMDIIGVGSLPIVVLTGFFSGVVITMQMSRALNQYGAVGQVGQIVAITLVRELGPVLTSLMIAGRVGSGIASELGSMLVTEQINAMRALGTDPIKKLVVPRVLATTSMLPVATIMADTMGILGGLFTSVFVLRISANLYLSRAWHGLSYMDLFGGLLKPVVFGVTVALVSCHCGLRTYGGTQGVGRSTTQAVVASSILIIVFNLFLTRFILNYTR